MLPSGSVYGKSFKDICGKHQSVTLCYFKTNQLSIIFEQVIKKPTTYCNCRFLWINLIHSHHALDCVPLETSSDRSNLSNSPSFGPENTFPLPGSWGPYMGEWLCISFSVLFTYLLSRCQLGWCEDTETISLAIWDFSPLRSSSSNCKCPNKELDMLTRQITLQTPEELWCNCWLTFLKSLFDVIQR